MFISYRDYLYISNYPQANFETNMRTNNQGISNPFNFGANEVEDGNLLFSANTSLLDSYKTDEEFVSNSLRFIVYEGNEKERKTTSIIDQYKKGELKHLEKQEIVATLFKLIYERLTDYQKSLPQVKEIKKNINLLLEEYNNACQNTIAIELKIDYQLLSLRAFAETKRNDINPFFSIMQAENINYTLSLINTDTIGDFLNFSADLDHTLQYWERYGSYLRQFESGDLLKIVEHISKVLLQKAKNAGINTKNIEKQIKTVIKQYKKALNKDIRSASTDKLNELFRGLYSQIAEKEGIAPLQNYEYLTRMHEFVEPIYDDNSYQYWPFKYMDGFLKDNPKGNYNEKFIEEMFVYFKNNNPDNIDEINKIEEVVKIYIDKYKNSDGDKTEIDAIICFEILKLRNIGKAYKVSPFFIIDNAGDITPFINKHIIYEFLNLSNDMDLVLNSLLPYEEDYTILFNKIKSVLIDMAIESGIDTTEISKQIEAAINEYKSNLDPNNKEKKPTSNKINELFRTLYSQIAQKNNLPQLTNNRYDNLIHIISEKFYVEDLFDFLTKYIDINNPDEVKDLLIKIFDYRTNAHKDIEDLKTAYICVIDKINENHRQGDLAFFINCRKKELVSLIERANERRIITNSDTIKIEQNGLADKDFKQGNVGSCWLLSSIKSLMSNPQTAKMLNANITIDEEGNTHVRLLGPNKTYIVTKEELLSHDEYSTGDYDIRAIEIAVNKHLLEERKKDVEGGIQIDAMNILLGNSITTITTNGDINLLEIENNKFEKALNEKIIEKLPELIKNKNLVWVLALNLMASENIEGEIIGENRSTTLITRHGYGVVDIDKDYIYISNPYDSKKTIKVLLKDIIDGGGILTISEPKDSNILKGIVLEVLSEYINGQIEKLKDKYITEYDFDKYYKEISSLINFINNSDINDEKKEELKTLLLNYFSQFLIDNEYLMNYTTYNEDSRANFKDIVTKLRQFVTENFNGDKKLMDQIDKILFSSISIKKKHHDLVDDIYSMSFVTEILNKQAIIIDETFPENTTTKITAKQEIIDIYIEQIKEAKEYYYYCKKMGCHIDAVKKFEALCSSATKFLEDNKDIKELKTFELSALLTLINRPEATEEEQRVFDIQMIKDFSQKTYKDSPFAQYMNIMN